jgi:hypothetical protein
LKHYFDNDGKDSWIDLDKMIRAVGGYAHWGKGRLVATDAACRKHYDLLFEYKFYDRYNWDKMKSTDIPLSRPLAWVAQHAGFAPGQDKSVGDPDHSIHVTDELMGEFQRQGLAREYDDYGLARRHLEWNQGGAISPAQIASALPVPGRGR